jgi:hypothetical protein
VLQCPQNFPTSQIDEQVRLLRGYLAATSAVGMTGSSGPPVSVLDMFASDAAAALKKIAQDDPPQPHGVIVRDAHRLAPTIAILPVKAPPPPGTDMYNNWYVYKMTEQCNKWTAELKMTASYANQIKRERQVNIASHCTVPSCKIRKL